MRTFQTGATRDDEAGKPDYEGFLHPLVIERYGRYMHAHRRQADGALRDSDNWQKGIPRAAYIKSAFRHFVDWWSLHRGRRVLNASGELMDPTEPLCALMFNTMGYLYEMLREAEDNKRRTP